MEQPLIHKGDNDYVLAEGETSVWVEVDGAAIYIRRHDGEFVVSAYPVGKENDDHACLGEFVVNTGN